MKIVGQESPDPDTRFALAEVYTVQVLLFCTVFAALYDFTATCAPDARHITSHVNYQHTQTHTQSVYNQTSPDTATSRAISTELADSVLAFDIRHLRLSYL